MIPHQDTIHTLLFFGLVLDRDRPPTPTPPIMAAPALAYGLASNLGVTARKEQSMLSIRDTPARRLAIYG